MRRAVAAFGAVTATTSSPGRVFSTTAASVTRRTSGSDDARNTMLAPSASALRATCTAGRPGARTARRIASAPAASDAIASAIVAPGASTCCGSRPGAIKTHDPSSALADGAAIATAALDSIDSTSASNALASGTHAAEATKT